MRLLVISDTQIGVSTVPLESQASVLQQAVTLAVEYEVDAFLHCGDVFEGPIVLPEHLRLVIDATAPLRQAGIPALLLRGNGRHDMAVRPQHALDVLREIPGFFVADRPWVFEIGDGHICALPWVHQGYLLSMLNGSTTHDAANEGLARMLVEIADDLHEKIRYTTNGSKVLAAHWAISGSALPSGLAADEMREPVLDWAELAAIGYDMVIAGHIHQPQMLGDSRIDTTAGIVPGSPQQLNHGEHGEHGVWLVDTNHALADLLPLDSPEFVTIRLGTSEAMEIADPDADLGYVVGSIPDGAYVRVQYEATEQQQSRIDTSRLTQVALRYGAAHVKVEPRIIRSDRTRAPDIAEAATRSAVDSFNAYCEAESLDGDVVKRARKLLGEWSA